MGVELRGVTKRYGDVEVLRPLDLVVYPGEFLTLLGPSGSGKTTVLKLMGGFTAPSGGAIWFGGRDITRDPPNRRPFNTVFQDYALFPHMTVLQNVGYGPLVQRRFSAETRRLIDDTIEIVGLTDFRNRYPSQLSGGQKQRVALARAIVCQPAVILLDEPLAALDAALRKQMQLFLKQIQRRIKTTFVFVTHDQDEAITMSDRIAVMRAGMIEQMGDPRAIYHRPATRFVAGFIGENNLVDGRIVGPGRIETALGLLTGEPSGPTAAGPGLIAMRPESLRIATDPGAAGIEGEVAEVLFGGATVRIAVRPAAAPGIELILSLPGNGGAGLPGVGGKVRVAHDPASSVVIGEPP
ncbi:MAG: ABC transporter ATP-binding protein [Paracoccaceae bacterium]